MVSLADEESARMASFYDNGFAPTVEVVYEIVINTFCWDNIF